MTDHAYLREWKESLSYQSYVSQNDLFMERYKIIPLCLKIKKDFIGKIENLVFYIKNIKC